MLITDELLLLLLAPPLKNSGIFSTAELSNEFDSTVIFELFELVFEFRNSNFEFVILTSSSSSSSSEDLPEDAGVVSLVASLLLLLATI